MSELDNLAPEQPQEEGQPQTELDFTGLVDNGKILGKYDTPQAAKEGYWNAVQEMNRTKEQLNTAVALIQHLQQGQPQPQKNVPDYVERLESVGIPVNELNQLVADRAQAIAANVVNQQLAPIVQGAQARNVMQSTYSDFAENEQSIANTIQSNPALAQRFNALVSAGMPQEALELGYFHWKNSSSARPNPNVESAKRAAMLPSGGSGAGRTANLPAGASPEAIKQAEYAAMQGDIRPLMELKMRNIPLTYSEQMEALMRGR
jgi:hypothetical protein